MRRKSLTADRLSLKMNLLLPSASTGRPHLTIIRKRQYLTDLFRNDLQKAGAALAAAEIAAVHACRVQSPTVFFQNFNFSQSANKECRHVQSPILMQQYLSLLFVLQVALEELVFLRRRYECLRSCSIPWSPNKNSTESISCLDIQHICEHLDQARGHRPDIRRGAEYSASPSKTGVQSELQNSTVQATLSALAENSVHQQTEMQELFRLQKLRDDSQLRLEDELRCALQRQRELEDELKMIKQGQEVGENLAVSPLYVNTLEISRSHASTQTRALETPAHRSEYLQNSGLCTEGAHNATDNYRVFDLIGTAISSAIEECRHLEQQMCGLQTAVYILRLLVAEQETEGKTSTWMRPCCRGRSYQKSLIPAGPASPSRIAQSHFRESIVLLPNIARLTVELLAIAHEIGENLYDLAGLEHFAGTPKDLNTISCEGILNRFQYKTCLQGELFVLIISFRKVLRRRLQG